MTVPTSPEGSTELLNLDYVDPRERLARWEEAVAATHLSVTTAQDVEADPRPFRARIRRRMIDDIALVECTCMPCAGDRGPSRISAADDEYVGLLILRRGVERFVQGDDAVEIRPGSIVTWDSRQAIRYAVPRPMTKLNVIVPRATVEAVADGAWTTRGGALDAAAPATRLLVTYLECLQGDAAGLSGPEATSARNAMLQLFVGAVRSSAGGTSPVPPAALRSTVERWIDEHLAGEITPAAIARAHGVSIRTIHRLFEATDDTLGSFVRTRRLERARENLMAGHEPIAAIAERWRFSGANHFSRAFRAQFGMPPSDMRALAGAKAALQL